MEHQENTQVVGIFDHPAQVEKAVNALIAAGVPADNILVRAQDGAGEQVRGPRVELQRAASTGALRGALVGAILGAICGILTSLIPGVEPHTIVLAAFGAAFGAALGAFFGPFVALELNETEIQEESHQIQQGRTLVIVDAPDNEARVRLIMVKFGAYDFSMANQP